MILHALIGFLAPHLGTVVSLVGRAITARHQARLLKAQVAANIELAEIKAQLEEFKIAHKPPPAYGIRLVKAFRDSNIRGRGPTLLAYTALDWLSIAVVPIITLGLVGFWTVDVLYGGATWPALGEALIMQCTAYYFGEKTRQHIASS